MVMVDGSPAVGKTTFIKCIMEVFSNHGIVTCTDRENTNVILRTQPIFENIDDVTLCKLYDPELSPQEVYNTRLGMMKRKLNDLVKYASLVTHDKKNTLLLCLCDRSPLADARVFARYDHNIGRVSRSRYKLLEKMGDTYMQLCAVEYSAIIHFVICLPWKTCHQRFCSRSHADGTTTLTRARSMTLGMKSTFRKWNELHMNKMKSCSIDYSPWFLLFEKFFKTLGGKLRNLGYKVTWNLPLLRTLIVAFYAKHHIDLAFGQKLAKNGVCSYMNEEIGDFGLRIANTPVDSGTRSKLPSKMARMMTIYDSENEESDDE